jgi:hypothetical protein
MASHPVSDSTFVVRVLLTYLDVCLIVLGMAIDYSLMLRELLAKHSDLATQRNALDVEMTKLTQLIKAAFNMLTPKEQKKAEEADFDKFLETHALGLSQAVRMAFSANQDQWLTPPQIRDYLSAVGFDFGNYIANPLASIGTTLKRMPSFELETKTLENGQTAYRLKTYMANALAARLIKAARASDIVPPATDDKWRKAVERGRK